MQVRASRAVNRPELALVRSGSRFCMFLHGGPFNDCHRNSFPSALTKFLASQTASTLDSCKQVAYLFGSHDSLQIACRCNSYSVCYEHLVGTPVRAVLRSNQSRLADEFMYWTGLGKCLQHYNHNCPEGSIGFLNDYFRRRRRYEAAALQKQPPGETSPRHSQ